MSDRPPLVSVITATYNRSNVLAYAIKSVLWQTLPDWELLVIGDACTDDTAEVVASFQDERIHFHNLATNVGEQSGPNNEGVRRSRGRYLAYLNHDDLWTPHHLESARQELERTGADLVFALMCVVNRDGPNTLANATGSGRYDPAFMGVAASSWFLRRELAAAVGPWQFYRDCRRAPSQDWILRAHRAGKDLRLNPRLTVVAIQSGNRPGSYAQRERAEHATYHEALRADPSFLERELTQLLLRAVVDPGVCIDRRFWPAASRTAKNALHAILRRLGTTPGFFWLLLRHPRFVFQKGALIDELRRVRGLPERRDRPGKIA